MGVVQQITAWSFSRWKDYQECPAKAKYKIIDKLKEPQSDAMARGERLHKLCETYLLQGGRVPTEVSKVKDVLREYKKLRARPEAEFAFDRGWKPVSWFSKDAWARVKADVTALEGDTVRVGDFKSGQLRDDQNDSYQLQLELYSVGGLIVHQEARYSASELVFLDHGKVVPGPVMGRDDLPRVQKLWEGRTKKMLADTKFKPTPSADACRFCHFKKSNHGPCPY